jgi:hypothetical protein
MESAVTDRLLESEFCWMPVGALQAPSARTARTSRARLMEARLIAFIVHLLKWTDPDCLLLD